MTESDQCERDTSGWVMKENELQIKVNQHNKQSSYWKSGWSFTKMYIYTTSYDINVYLYQPLKRLI